MQSPLSRLPRRAAARSIIRSGVAVVLTAVLAAAGPVATLAPERAAIPAPRSANLPPPPPKTLALLQKARISGVTGWQVRDLDTGEVLDAWAADRPFVPASVAKLPTAAFALDRLGPAHRFETRLLATAAPSRGVIAGDLVLQGGGDPELDTMDLVPLVEALRAQGITRVTGGLIGDAGPIGGIAEIAPGQPDDANYNPGVAGLSLNFNRVRVEWPRGGGKGTIAVRAQAEGLSPLTDAVAVLPVQGVSPALVRTTSDSDEQEIWHLNQRALRRPGGRWLPVRRPAAYTTRVLAALAEEAGIEMPGQRLEPGAARRAGHFVARHASRPLDRILSGMLFHSTNLTAELVGLAASSTKNHDALLMAATPGSTVPVARLSAGGAILAGTKTRRTLPASAATMNEWAADRARFARGDEGFRLANHSGLSLASRLSPERMVDLLVAEVRRPGAGDNRRRPGGVAQLLRRHNIAVKNDGLDHARIEVAAKTGTMNFVRGLAGYVHTARDRRLAFAVFSNDLARRETMRGPRGWSARARAFERALIREWVRMADAPG